MRGMQNILQWLMSKSIWLEVSQFDLAFHNSARPMSESFFLQTPEKPRRNMIVNIRGQGLGVGVLQYLLDTGEKYCFVR